MSRHRATTRPCRARGRATIRPLEPATRPTVEPAIRAPRYEATKRASARPGRTWARKLGRLCTWCTQPVLTQYTVGTLFMNTVHKNFSKKIYYKIK